MAFAGYQNLELQIREEQIYARKRKGGMDMLPIQEQVAEYIYELRNTTDWFSYFDYLNWSLKPTAGPGAELLRIGLPAVPQLMKAMQEERFTRTMFPYGTMWIYFETPVYVRDLALGILSILAGRDLSVRTGPAGSETIDWNRTISNAWKWFEETRRTQPSSLN